MATYNLSEMIMILTQLDMGYTVLMNPETQQDFINRMKEYAEHVDSRIVWWEDGLKVAFQVVE